MPALKFGTLRRTQSNQKEPTLHLIPFSENKIAEKAFQGLEIALNTLKRIVVVRPYERISEEPRILSEEIVRCRNVQHPQILDGENGNSARIALTERMNLP